MIRQRSVTYKTSGATLNYTEMGDVVVNSASAIDIILPTPSPNFWYCISNVGAGEISIKYDSATITTLKQYEQALFLANGTTDWWMSKGGGAISKSDVESVLTGEISSHTHLMHNALVNTHGIFMATAFANADPEKAYTFVSYDGITWTQFGNSPAISETLRDPSMIHWNDRWWIIATAGGGTNATNYFYLFNSSDLITWSSATNISTGASALSTWAPTWFVDPSDNSLHVIVSISVTAGYRALYEMHPTNLAMTTWSTPVLISGTGFPVDYIDGSIIKIDSTYYLFYKNNIAGNEWIEMATSTSLTSGYSVVHTGDWAGWKAAVGAIEAPVLIKLDEKYRMYFFHYTSLYAGQEYYSETEDATFATGWTTPSAVLDGYNHVVPIRFKGLLDYERIDILTKAEIEAVLTGEISSHSHANPSGLAPTGGSTGQVLAKNSATNYDYSWADGPAATNGIPSGGTTEQLLAKIDGTDYNCEWVDGPAAANGIPSGGTAGQILVKDTGTNYDASWATIPYAIDVQPASANSHDDEFSDTSLDAKWSWVNQGTATWTEADGCAVMTIPSQSGDTSRIIIQTVPTGDFTATAKVWLPTFQLNYFTAGICLYNSANGYRTYMAIRNQTAAFTSQVDQRIHVLKMTGNTTWSSDPVNIQKYGLDFMYVRVRRSGTTLYYEYSYDGVSFITALSEETSTFMNAVSHIGLGHWRNNSNGVVYNCRFDWFRVTE